MANALKCDRCDMFFDPYDLKKDEKFIQFNNPLIRTSEDYSNCMVTKYFKESRTESRSDVIRRTIDLCPECSIRFGTWMGVDI